MKLVIREATQADRADLAEISRNTWDGHDYLENTAENWLSDGYFYVGETSGKAVACAKITRMPGDVAWLEGLRVHPAFQGMGYGREISDWVLRKARSLVESRVFSCIEFSTYVNNVESRSLAGKQGFEVTEWFHVIGREEPFPQLDGLEVTESEIRSEDLSIYPGHAPCGWKYIHSSAPEIIQWFKKNARVWQVSSGARFLTSSRNFEISPLASALEDPGGFVKGSLKLVAQRGTDYSEMMIHDSHGVLLKTARENGYEYWEEDGAANIPVYRFSGL